MMNDADRRESLHAHVRQRVGTVLNGKWRLDSLLGMGGMAAVYAGTHRNGHRVAIKILHPHLCQDDGLRARLQQEGYVANSIEHPGALRILDDDRAEDGAVFLVMELLSGEGLDARLKRKGWRLPRHEALAITAGVLDVLVAAHAKGIVHRDIKPDNVFITRAGEVKVLDFGIARMRAQPDPRGGGLGWSYQGALFGTLGFMAPEQALGRSEEMDARTDLWGVGAMLYTVLSGRLVHEAPTANEQLVLAATRRAAPLASVMPEVDGSLSTLVDTALAFERSDRWQSASEMLEAVRAVALADSAGTPVLPGAPEGIRDAAARLLRVPPVSVEIDLDPVRARWGTGQLPTASQHSAPPIAPTFHGRTRRLSPLATTLFTAAIVAVVGGTVVRWLHGPGALSHTAKAMSAPPATATAPKPDPITDSAFAIPTPVAPIVAEEPPSGPSPSVTSAPVEEPAPRVRPGRSGQRRSGVARLRRRSPPAASVVDDEALWGRRH